MPTIIDTSVWIDFFRGAPTREVELLGGVVRQGHAAVGDLILCEILQGLKQDQDFRTVQRHFKAFPIFSMVGAEIAVKSAQNYRRLRSKSITVRKTIDCLIATFCIENDFVLLHNDRDFEPFERELGLTVAGDKP